MEIMLAYSLVLANTGLKMRVVPPFSSYGIQYLFLILWFLSRQTHWLQAKLT